MKFFGKLHNIYVLLNAEGAKEIIFKEPSALMAKLVFGNCQQRRRVLLAPTVTAMEPLTVLDLTVHLDIDGETLHSKQTQRHLLVLSGISLRKLSKLSTRKKRTKMAFP